MADKISTLADELAGAIRESGSRKTSAYDTPATVRRIDGATAWVHIPGGVDETPVQLTIAASVGDTVQVRVSGGTAWLVGNASAPPTDDAVAKVAAAKAEDAAQVAEAAETLGAEARQTARAAAKIAADTEQHFWFTETGADTGAHITEKTKEDFLADPDNGGGNLLARSNGIAVRDGKRELSIFDADGFTVNNEHDIPVMDSGFNPDGNYTGTKYDVFAYSGESPFVMDLPWDVRAGYEGNVTFTFFSSYPSTSVSLDPSGHWSLNGRTLTLDASICASMTSGGVTAVRAQYYATGRFPFYTLGTRGAGPVGPFSTVIGENGVARGSTSLAVGEGCDANGTNSFAQGLNTYAGTNASAFGRGTKSSVNSQMAVGQWNIEHSLPGPLFIVGDGSSASARSDSVRVDMGGRIFIKETDAAVSAALTAMGWGSLLSSSMLNISDALEKIITRLSLYDKPLVTNANWSSGTLSVPGSSKYRVFEVVQGGAATICTRYGNDLRGFSLSGNSTANNWNQYVRAFGATADWSTEVWTLEWAKQLSHVTSSGYHTSGTTQAVTEIRGLIPLQNA